LLMFSEDGFNGAHGNLGKNGRRGWRAGRPRRGPGDA
jgi:hypothetical protein